MQLLVDIKSPVSEGLFVGVIDVQYGYQISETVVGLDRRQ